MAIQAGTAHAAGTVAKCLISIATLSGGGVLAQAEIPAAGPVVGLVLQGGALAVALYLLWFLVTTYIPKREERFTTAFEAQQAKHAEALKQLCDSHEGERSRWHADCAKEREDDRRTLLEMMERMAGRPGGAE